MKFLPTLAVAAALAAPGLALAAGTVEIPAQKWSFDGLLGVYDRAELQRGYQVYREVCAACHGANLLRYRDLAQIGLGEDMIKFIAASDYKILAGPNEKGEMYERLALPSDPFKPPFPNEQAARVAFNGAYPPDLSLITKARKHGSDYVYALLVGYGEPPPGVELGAGLQYNKYFPPLQIAMPAPLSEGQVTYADGTPATVERMARDVTAFLTWAGEPALEYRHRMGFKAILFLIALTALMYVAKRKIWADVH
jgi:ubiquinol-cytochrome c reductase cytochrome c1 subunit